jgi:Flp pilus assembly protein TadD
MTSRKPTSQPTADDVRARKIKLAEGGIVFALVFGLCVFLGIHFSGQDAGEPIAARVSAPDVPPTAMAIQHEPVVASTPAVAADDGTEPVAVADAAVSEPVDQADGEPLSIREMLPEVPIYVTYSSAEQTFLEGRHDEAAEMFAQYCDEHPENAWGHYMRGLSLWKADRDDEAAAAFESALAIKGDHLKSLINLARVQLELEQDDQALATIEQALAIAPSSADARRVLGRVQHNLGQLEAAVATYSEVLRLDGNDAWSLNNLALVWIEMERFDQALAPLARATELLPDVAVIRNNLGVALERTGHAAAAREQFAVAADAGSAKGESSLLRLDETVIAADEPAIDLTALAAAWSVDADEQGPAQEPDATVAAITPADTSGDE